jgi:hypothetical protein
MNGHARRIITFLLVLVCTCYWSSLVADCGEYFQATKDLEIQKRDLLWRYKGTAVTLLGCAGVCSGESNPEGCALVTCGLSCLAIGFENCVTFFSEAAALQQYERRVESLNVGCSSGEPSGQTQSLLGPSEDSGTFKITNSCQHPIKVAIYFRDLNNTWRAMGWWNIDGGETTYLSDSSNNKLKTTAATWYWYAETINDANLVWKGSDIHKFGNLDLPMARLEDKSGDSEWTVTCPKPSTDVSPSASHTLDSAHRWVVIASRSTVSEATSLAAEYKQKFSNTTVFLSENGWYAITVGTIEYPGQANLKDKWIAAGTIPSDSYLASGSKFRQEFKP